MNKRKTIISLVLTFVILLGAMGAYRMLSNKQASSTSDTLLKEELREVQVQQILPKTVPNQIPVDGRISAYGQVNITASVSGILGSTAKLPKAGVYFKKGELLFDIDQRKALYNLNALRSSLLNAITLMMPDLKLDYPSASFKWEQYLDEFEIEKPIQKLPEVDHKKEKNFLAARNIYNLYYNIKSAEVQLSEYQIHAPFSGVITQVHVFPGSMVIPGQQLASIVNTSRYELTATIPEEQLSSISIGNLVDLRGTSNNQKWKGKVTRIGQQIDPTTQSVPVYISVRGSGLRDGLFLRGQIRGSPLIDVISLSKKLIVNQEFIYTLADSTLQLQQLKIKARDQEQVHAEALMPETWIVMESPLSLFEGQKVTPIFNTN